MGGSRAKGTLCVDTHCLFLAFQQCQDLRALSTGPYQFQLNYWCVSTDLWAGAGSGRGEGKGWDLAEGGLRPHGWVMVDKTCVTLSHDVAGIISTDQCWWWVTGGLGSYQLPASQDSSFRRLKCCGLVAKLPLSILHINPLDLYLTAAFSAASGEQTALIESSDRWTLRYIICECRMRWEPDLC